MTISERIREHKTAALGGKSGDRVKHLAEESAKGGDAEEAVDAKEVVCLLNELGKTDVNFKTAVRAYGERAEYLAAAQDRSKAEVDAKNTQEQLVTASNNVESAQAILAKLQSEKKAVGHRIKMADDAERQVRSCDATIAKELG